MIPLIETGAGAASFVTLPKKVFRQAPSDEALLVTDATAAREMLSVTRPFD
jgi:hypothetical protein